MMKNVPIFTGITGGRGRGARGGGRAVKSCMAVHSRMTIDPRIPTMPGRSTSGFHRPRADITCTKREMKHEVFDESHGG